MLLLSQKFSILLTGFILFIEGNSLETAKSRERYFGRNDYVTNSKIEEVYYESEIDKEIEILEERLENIKEKQGINFEKVGRVKTPVINQEHQEIKKSSEDRSIKKDPPVFSDTDNVILKIAGALILAGFLFGLFSSL